MGAFTNYPNTLPPNADNTPIWLPTIYPPSTHAAAAIVSAANQVKFLMITIPRLVIASKIVVEVASKSASADQTADFGLYSADGSRLILQTSAGVAVGSGITNGAFAVTIKNVNGTGSIVIPPNDYIWAYTSQDAAVTFRSLNLASGNAILLTQTVKQYGVAGSAATNGILPSSLGTLTTTSGNNTWPLAILLK